ncbi:molybdopterin-synthase adenylyltransferase MoeB [Crenobacter sp. SG2305]|uniref:molybdopterin-synthase adenylyltransferase MoeB n=1 Tax=Crenobacter oryzisoli TaxID=3056844 RepID=UPI0025AA9020|nr:molybdopterin-synthase adenylyltransferase MoeB [Crenobacter sp. SG2305]MDN0083576.1 molybdopterin-synthase adenylyltransferase MoeB [Crenobacter sp. SG2305]
MKAKDRELVALRARIAEISPTEAQRLQQQGAALIDVREADEIAQGSPPGALRLGRGFLELRVEDAIPDFDQPVVLMCNGGTRSLFAADSLARMGYSTLFSMIGGFSRWKAEGLPFEQPSQLDGLARQRYARHLSIPEVGEEGQAKLMASKVLLIGAGGLGCPAAFYLAAAGVGTLGFVDDDVVDRSNLQRQILHSEAKLGMPKVRSARQTVEALNPTVKVDTYETRLSSANVEAIFAGYDVVVDGSDNFPTRYLVNDACVKLGIPNVHGSVYRFEGQASVFWPGYAKRRGPCYRCLYPEPPPAEFAPSCMEAGVLGVLPGVIGLLEAVETLKLLLGVGDPLVGRLLCYDALKAEFRELELQPNSDCPYCAPGRAFPGYIDYEQFCHAG